jgi:hypothetical protein
MKTIKTIAIFSLFNLFLFNASSCIVFVKKDNGKHKGWTKNPNNPHHPASTNPGKAKAKAPVKSKGNQKK